jgi:hypothetical protein
MRRDAAATRTDRWELLAAMSPFVALCLSQWDYVPIWDGRIYTDCLLNAAARGPFPSAYVCVDHPTIAWAFLTSLLSHVIPDKFWPLLVMHIALGMIGLWSFRELACLVLPTSTRDANLLTACFGACPLFVASAVNPSPDFGVLIFFLLLLRSLTYARWIEAGVAGVLLSLSKETGVLLLGIATGTHAVIEFVSAPGHWKQRLRGMTRYAPTLAGPASFLIWIALRPAREAGQGGPLWGGKTLSDLLRMLLWLDLSDIRLHAQLAVVLVLQFSWTLSLLTIWRWATTAKLRFLRTPPTRLPLASFFDFTLAATIFALTRFLPFSNPRYLIPILPLLLLCAGASLHDLLPRARRWSAFVLVALLLASNFLTFDPLSRILWGTFSFGDHQMLRMTSLTGECCGEGRDQLVYNLQHTALHHLLNLARSALLQDADHRFSGHPLADWYLVGSIDPATRRRTLAHGAPVERLLTYPRIRDGVRPRTVYYLHLPNFADDSGQEARLHPWYRPTATHVFTYYGYRLHVTELTRR